MTNWRKPTLVATAMYLASLLAGSAADALRWDAARDRIDATIETWTVPQLLQHVATATGWEIYLDPEITNRIPASFSGKQTGEALRRLLGEYSYALVPETNAHAKFFVFRTSREQATRAIQPLVTASKSSTNRIGNELIVTLKPGEKIEDLAKRLGAKIVGRSDGQNTYRLRFDDNKSADTARTSLQSDPSVESVDSNYYVHQPETIQPLGSSGAALGLTPKISLDGKYTVVGLIDTAVQPKGGNFTQFLLDGSTVDGSKEGTDPTHGTSMALTFFNGVAAFDNDKPSDIRLSTPNAYPSGNETTTTYDIAAAIFQAAKDGAIIFSISSGGPDDSTYLKNTVFSVTSQGGVVIAAAGNSPVTTPTYPAAYQDVIAVTALDRNGKLASYANRGAFVDVAAPGGSVITFNGQQYYVVGTSASTAYVSGLAATIAESKKLRGDTLRQAVLQTLAPK